MVSKPIVVFLITSAIAVASSASAAAAPVNDLYSQSANRAFNQLGTALGTALAFNSESNVAATAGEILPDGITEFDTCNSSHFGATLWYEFHPQIPGRVQLRAAPVGNFDPVLAFYPFDVATGRPDRTVFPDCSDDPGNPTATEELVFDVRARSSYKVQVGGYAGTTTSPTAAVTGSFQLLLDFYPDTDGDGVLDREDKCPTVPGTQGGCPAPPAPPPVMDRDHDGTVDAKDRCPDEDARARDRNHDGCLDIVRLHADARLKFRDTPDGVRVRSLIVYLAERGSTIRVSCSRQCGMRTYPNISRSGRWPVGYLAGRRLKARTKITVRVTLPRSLVPRSIGRYQIITIRKQDATKKTYCIPVSGRGHVRC